MRSELNAKRSEMQANMEYEQTGELNAKELAKRERISVAAIRLPYAKLRAQGHALFASQFDCNAPLSAEQIEILRPGKFQAVRTTKEPKPPVAHTGPAISFEGSPNEAAPEKDFGWKAKTFIFFAFAIVVGHSVLVWYDMAELWAMPGRIGGCVVFLFILSGMVLMSDSSERMTEIRENMLWAVGLLEALAIVVHKGAFSRNAAQAYAAGMGIEYIWALSAVICLCSIGATVFYQKVIK
jgi:hypothetical protein